LPDGQKLSDLDDFLKMFYIYVIGFSPSIESISHYVNYELELRKINEKDYRKEIKINKEAVSKIAKSKGITEEEYINSLIEKMKNEEIKKLKKKYNLINEDETEKTDFEDRKNQFNQIIENFINKHKNI
jgi:hypothetical protein